MRDLASILSALRAADGIRLVRRDMSALEDVGVYCDGLCIRAGNITVIDSRITDQRRVNVTDAHEYGHHQYLADDLLDAPQLLADKQEALAEREAAGICLAPERMVEACLSGCTSYREFADVLGITEDAFVRWLAIMQRKHGSKPVRTGRYKIIFDPLPVKVVEVKAG